MSPRTLSTLLVVACGLAAGGCGGSNSAGGKSHGSGKNGGTIATLTAPRTGKVPTPAPTPTAIPASDFTATVSGTITDNKSHAPVAGVKVVVGNALRKGVTNAQGQYQIAFPAGVSIAVTASKSGYAGAIAQGKLPKSGHAVLNLQLTKAQAGVPPVPPAPTTFGSK